MRCSLKIAFAVFLLFVGAFAPVRGQSDSDTFVVRNVAIEAVPNPRFIRRIAEVGIPWDRVTKKTDVECIKKQLFATGLFKRVDSRLLELKETGGYELVLTIEFSSANPVYRLGKVEVVDVGGVDHLKFQKLLRSDRLFEKPVSLQTADYWDFETRLFDLLKQSIADKEMRNWQKKPWVELRLNKQNQLEIKIYETFRTCLSSASLLVKPLPTEEQTAIRNRLSKMFDLMRAEKYGKVFEFFVGGDEGTRKEFISDMRKQLGRVKAGEKDRYIAVDFEPDGYFAMRDEYKHEVTFVTGCLKVRTRSGVESYSGAVKAVRNGTNIWYFRALPTINPTAMAGGGPLPCSTRESRRSLSGFLK